MEYLIRQVTSDDKKDVMDIFNYYIENSFAAYFENKLGYEFFGMLMEMAKGYPFYVVEAQDRKVIGYGLLRPHLRMNTFKRSAELTCFISPDYTGKGIGTSIMDKLILDAKQMGVDTILASISSENRGSINFHKKYGFVECGVFKNVAKKFDKDFDEVWMQLFI